MNNPYATRPLTFGSLFDGIGAFSLGLVQSGMSLRWSCEIDPDCRRVTAARFPGVKQYPDVTLLKGCEVEPVDVVCGGSPCQGLSVAGKRGGLGDERSGLFREMGRIADAIAPLWLLWENVPGAFTTEKGEDFACVLEIVTGFCPQVPKGGWRSGGFCAGPKRIACWRVLDGQFFGVPQRRKRIFLVARSGDVSRLAGPASGEDVGRLRSLPLQVLLERSCLLRDSSSGKKKGPRVAACIGGRSHAAGVNHPGRGGEDDVNLVLGGEPRRDPRCGIHGGLPGTGPVGMGGDVVSALRCAGDGRGHRIGAEEAAGNQLVCGSLQSHSREHGHAMTTQQAAESGQLIHVPETAFCLPASARGTGDGHGQGWNSNYVAGAEVFQANGAAAFRSGSVCLSASDDNGSNQVVVASALRGTHHGPDDNAAQANHLIAGPLCASDGGMATADRVGELVPQAFREIGEGHQGYQDAEQATSLRTPGGGGSGVANVLVEPIAFHATQDPISGRVSPALSRGNPAGQATTAVAYIAPRILRNSESSNEVGIKDGSIADSLSTDGPGAVGYNVVGMAQEGANHAYEASVSGCLQGKGLKPTGNEAGTVVVFQERGRDKGRTLDVQEEKAYALLSPAPVGRAQERNIQTGMTVRRLTPTECGRLQGMPDGWLEDGIDPPLSDSAKYRCWGNAGVCHILTWIGRRIIAVHHGLPIPEGLEGIVQE